MKSHADNLRRAADHVETLSQQHRELSVQHATQLVLNDLLIETLGATDVDLGLLRNAVQAGDKTAELVFRIDDILRRHADTRARHAARSAT